MPRETFDRLLRRRFALPLLLAGVAILTLFNEIAYHRTALAVRTSSALADARIATAGVLQLLTDAETGQRGYLLTGRASGDYQRYFMKDGKRHPHIIDPRSGDTIDLVASVTIITSGGNDAGLRSDGNTKPLFIAGPQHWRAMAQRLGLNEVLLIDAKRHIEMTPAMQERIAADSAINQTKAATRAVP